MKLGLFVFVLCLFSFAAAAKNEQPARTGPAFGEGLAVDIRLERISKDEIKKIKALGFDHVRIGINWPEVEKERGVFAWDYVQPREAMADDLDKMPTFTYEGMIGFLHKLGFSASVILYFGNTLYTGEPVKVGAHGGFFVPAAPRTIEAVEAFGTFAAATARHFSRAYGADTFTWLIWNEPDTDGGFPPRTDGDIVGQFVTSVCRRIKSDVPVARVTAPSLGVEDGGAFRYGFIRDLFRTANPLTCLDAFTVHPYRPTAPETAPADYVELASFIEKWQPEGKRVPISADEWGYPLAADIDASYRMAWRSYTEEEQAAIYLRMYLVNLAAGVPMTNLYEWRNSGPDVRQDEHVYGMMAYDGREKPAIKMWRYVMPKLKGRKLVESLKPKACGGKTHVLRFAPRFNMEKDVIVAWTETATSKVRLAGRVRHAVDVFGRQQDEADAYPLGGVPLVMDIDGKEAGSLSCLR